CPPPEDDPPGQEAQAAEWGDHAEPPPAADRQEVQAAGEDHRAGHEQPAGDDRALARPARALPRHREERERVEHVIAHARLEDGEHVGSESAAKAVSRESAEGDGDERRERTDAEEEAVRRYSTVTDFARLRGWSTSQPRRTPRRGCTRSPSASARPRGQSGTGRRGRDRGSRSRG